MLVLAFDIDFDVLALCFQIHFSRSQLTSSQGDVSGALTVQRADYRFDVDAPVSGQADQSRELPLENALPALKLYNPLFRACPVELGASHFNRQFETFARSLTRKIQNPGIALPVGSHQIQ